ncbi:protein-disulfide reductase DsbD domain-containing protein [Rhodophyticola sp. SM2404]
MIRQSLLSLTAALALSDPAFAEWQTQSQDEIVSIRMLEGWRMENGHHMAALEITLADGWKTYWRAPGESGIPPVLSFSGASGIDGMAIHWPAPQVFTINGMRSIGYDGRVILPLELLVDETGEIQMDGEVELGVCQDVCVPVTIDLEALLPPAGVRPDPQIVAALSDRPMTAHEAGASSAQCAITPISDGMRVEVTLEMPSLGQAEAMVVELPMPGVWVSEAELTRDGARITASADIVPPNSRPFALDRSSLRFTVIGSQGAVELQGCSG